MPAGPGSLLVEVADRAPDVSSVMNAVADAVRTWVGVGPVFLATADPVTGGFSGTFTFDIPAEAAARFFEIEMSGRDVASFRAVSESTPGVLSLTAATEGHLERSERWRDVMSPLDWGDEVRAAVRAHGQVWGYLCLHREAHDKAFTPRDTSRLAALLPSIASALRTAATVPPPNEEPLHTGVILADRAGRVVSTTGAAAAWLAEMGPPRAGGLPLLLEGLCRCVAVEDEPLSATLTTRAGRLAVVEAAPLHVAGEPQIAVVIQSAPPTLALERFAAAANLTARERQVVECTLRGLSTREISAELGISVYTVQAHLTAVFAKTGTSSRRELVTRLRR
jgi:DNA-binding CsgD family transcriptional regulator